MVPHQRPDKNVFVERYHRTYGQEYLQLRQPSTLQEARVLPIYLSLQRSYFCPFLFNGVRLNLSFATSKLVSVGALYLDVQQEVGEEHGYSY
jgi:hypothetical protein